jgi:hypothetical protein
MAQVLENIRDKRAADAESTGDFPGTSSFDFVVQVAQNQQGVVNFAIEQRHNIASL